MYTLILREREEEIKEVNIHTTWYTLTRCLESVISKTSV